jgi:hypothetical protein
MLHQFLEPTFCYSNPLFLRVFIRDFEALLLCFGDDVLHVLFSKCAKHTEKELSLRQLVRELLLRWKVLAQLCILHGIIVKVFNK